MCAVSAGLALAACGGSDAPRFETLHELPESRPGDIISLRTNGTDIEYISRRTGEIFRFELDSPDTVEIVATVAVSTEGEQRGLLGHTLIDGRRFAAWTEPNTFDLVVGEVTSGEVDRIVWAGTTTSPKAVGGHLEVYQGQLLLGLGELTGWGRDHRSGALVLLDPDGKPDQAPVVLSDHWNNPFAFTVTSSGEVWVADNAPDGSDLPVNEREPERIGRGDADSPNFLEPPPQRAPTAIIELPDGRVGVCGFLDNEMRAYGFVGLEDDLGGVLIGNDGEPTVVMFDRAGTIGPCQTAAVELADGSIVTVANTDDGQAILIRPT
jgi:hypothetical protein